MAGLLAGLSPTSVSQVSGAIPVAGMSSHLALRVVGECQRPRLAQQARTLQSPLEHHKAASQCTHLSAGIGIDSRWGPAACVQYPDRWHSTGGPALQNVLEASLLSHLAPVCSSSCRRVRITIRLGRADKRRALNEEGAPPHLPAPAPAGTPRLPPTPSPAGQRPPLATAAAPALTQACCRTLGPSCAPAAREGPPDPPAGSRSRAVQGALILQTGAPRQPGRGPPVLLHGQNESTEGICDAGSSHHAAARGSVLPEQTTATQGSQVPLSSCEGGGP